jgi:hypothetical protein
MKHIKHIFSAVAACAFAQVASAAPSPIVANEWFPLVNGAVYEYQNIATISSSTLRSTVTANVPFAGRATYQVTWDVSCDRIADKSDWGTRNFGNGQCEDSDRYFVADSTGHIEIGNVNRVRDYGYSDNRQPFQRIVTYNNAAPPILKNGITPGEYVFVPAIPTIRPAGFELSGRSGEYWGGSVTLGATYVDINLLPITRSANEGRREVGVYNKFSVPAGNFETLFVEDAIADVRSGYAPSYLRYQALHYAKGIGPVVIRTGDTARNGGFTQLGYPQNIRETSHVMEEFHLARHNLQGCPGYDPSLPPLPANSGNICASIYGNNPGASLKSMVEYRNAAFDYYFMTSRPNEQALLDDPQYGFARTGKSFAVAGAPATGLSPMTRFYFDKAAKNASRGTHFYTLLQADVDALNALNPGNTQAPRKPYNEGIDSYAYLPSGTAPNQTCPANTVPVYRMFRGSQRFPDDPNHRFVADRAIYDQFVATGWDAEGIAFCALPTQ